ncbi:hypothetical protein F5880DRAFT_1619546, partial [Lentinula raphanica]
TDKAHNPDGTPDAANILDAEDHLRVAPASKLEQKEKTTEGIPNRGFVDAQQQVSIVQRRPEDLVGPPTPLEKQMPGNSVPTKQEPDSISWALRTRRQALRRSPYPTRSKRLSQSSRRTSDSMNTTSTTVSSEAQTSSSINDTHFLQTTVLAQSSFGFTAFDYHERKVLYKEAHTSWYTYSTSFPIDNPPELPHNASVLKHNVIFMHINEAQKKKYHPGPLSKLLKYCVRLWIWNGDSSNWEKISVGDRRSVNGYDLCLSLRYRTEIYPQWVVPKSLKRAIAESS